MRSGRNSNKELFGNTYIFGLKVKLVYYLLEEDTHLSHTHTITQFNGYSPPLGTTSPPLAGGPKVSIQHCSGQWSKTSD